MAIERYRDARARIRGIAVSVDVDRSIAKRRVGETGRRRERREFGGVSFSILIFSFLDDDEKDRARHGDVVVVALDARAFYFL